MIPVLFTAKVAGKMQDLVAIGGQGRRLRGARPRDGQSRCISWRSATRPGFFTTVPTVEGTPCPAPTMAAAIEWLGRRLRSGEQSLLCSQHRGVRDLEARSEPAGLCPRPGFIRAGRATEARQMAPAWLTAIDMDTGAVRWRNPLPYPGQGWRADYGQAGSCSPVIWAVSLYGL